MAGQVGLSITTIIMVALLKSTNAVEYVVGDDFGWNIPPNKTFYSEWASSKNFQIGDSVMFNLKGNHNLLAEVSTLDEYQNCFKPGIYFADFNLTAVLVSNGSRFFHSMVDDQCERGMKVILTVGSPTNTSALTPSGASSLSSLGFGAAVAITLSMLLVAFFN